MTNLKRRDTPESAAHWDHAERTTREVEAEIAKEKARARRPHLTNAELLAMSRMLRLHLHDDKFFNPIDAHETRKLALRGMAKIEGWRAGGGR